MSRADKALPKELLFGSAVEPFRVRRYEVVLYSARRKPDMVFHYSFRPAGLRSCRAGCSVAGFEDDYITADVDKALLPFPLLVGYGLVTWSEAKVHFFGPTLRGSSSTIFR